MKDMEVVHLLVEKLNRDTLHLLAYMCVCKISSDVLAGFLGKG
jgi:hypothetical protein